ncbi:MAG: hypothetical protein IJC72_02530 [Clostridia bacterium]|nr:hypothetical protein [Clostridia bacterium]
MQKKIVKKGKGWFRALKQIMRIRYKRPEFKFLGEEFDKGCIILSNHEGTDAPMSLEMYLDKNLRFWGAYEMNSGLVKMYKYQSRVYFHEKKHWNLFLARLFCLIASPLTNLFYKGLNLISTYKDAGFYKTVRESFEAISKGENIVIFPEDSEEGYLNELKGFFGGFVVLAEYCAKKGVDVPIVVSYFVKEAGVYAFDSPVKYSELIERYKTKDEVIKVLLLRCNELGKTERQSNKKDLDNNDQKELKKVV